MDKKFYVIAALENGFNVYFNGQASWVKHVEDAAQYYQKPNQSMIYKALSNRGSTGNHQIMEFNLTHVDYAI